MPHRAHLHSPCPMPCLLVQRLAQSPCLQGQLPPLTSHPTRPGRVIHWKLEQCRTPQRKWDKCGGIDYGLGERLHKGDGLFSIALAFRSIPEMADPAPGSSDWWGESPAKIQAPQASIGPAVANTMTGCDASSPSKPIDVCLSYDQQIWINRAGVCKRDYMKSLRMRFEYYQ